MSKNEDVLSSWVLWRFIITILVMYSWFLMLMLKSYLRDEIWYFTRTF